MTEQELIEIKQRLSGARVTKFGPMPDSRETWLQQMDECAVALNLPNVYRHQSRQRQAAE